MTDADLVRYFYLPKRNKYPAEIILVYFSENQRISLPSIDEIYYLDAFYERCMTLREKQVISTDKKYEVYYSFETLHRHHQKHNVAETVMRDLAQKKLLQHFPYHQVSLDVIFGMV